MIRRFKKRRKQELPTTPQLEEALAQEKRRKRFHNILRSTVFVLATVAAVSILIATLLFPVMRIYGSSMKPTLEDGEIVVALKIKEFKNYKDPYILVLGGKEAEERTVSINVRGSNKQIQNVPLDDFVALCRKQNEERNLELIDTL